MFSISKCIFTVALILATCTAAGAVPASIDRNVVARETDDSAPVATTTKRTCVEDEDCLELDYCASDGFCQAPAIPGTACTRDEMCSSRKCNEQDGSRICLEPVVRVARWLIWTLVIGAIVILALCCILICCCCSCCAAA